MLGEVWAWFTDPANYEGSNGIPRRIWEHIWMSGLATTLALLIALPVGLFIGHTRRLEFLAVSIGNIGRALPTFGVLGLVFPFTLDWPGDFGFLATLIALVLLAIPPILTNTYVGVKGVEADTVEAARGMGMRGRQVLGRLELPLSAPLIVAGVRTAAVQVVATATLWAVVAGGGLGRYIVDGFALGTIGRDQLVGGAILVALLAVVTELSFAFIERVVAPRTGYRKRSYFDLLGRTTREASVARDS